MLLQNIFGYILLLFGICISIITVESVEETTKQNNETIRNLVDALKSEIKRFMIQILQAQTNSGSSMVESFLKQEQKIDDINEALKKLNERISAIEKTLPATEYKSDVSTTTSSAPNDLKFDENLNCISNCGDNELPTDCTHVSYDAQHSAGDVYVLKPPTDELKPFGVFCLHRAGDSWTIIQRRQDGSVDFYRNWHNYTKGFGNVSGEYWLGLERIHALTSNGKYKLWIDMETREGKHLYAYYEKFSVANESEGYKLEVDSYSGNAGDGLVDSNGKKFTTFDMDNDEKRNGNCAIGRHSAWWFKYCTIANLNGDYEVYHERHGLWWWALQSIESLKYVHMATQPV